MKFDDFHSVIISKQKNSKWSSIVPMLGCRVGTVNEPAIESLHALLLQYNDIKDGLDKLSAKLADPIRSERASMMDFLL